MLNAILVLGASATKLEFGKDILVQTGQQICYPCRMDVISTSRDMTLQQDLKPDKRSAMCSHQTQSDYVQVLQSRHYRTFNIFDNQKHRCFTSVD
jgi:hypothetical protein